MKLKGVKFCAGLRSLCLHRTRIYWSMGKSGDSGTTNWGITRTVPDGKTWVTLMVHSAGLKLAIEKLSSRVKEERTSITELLISKGVVCLRGQVKLCATKLDSAYDMPFSFTSLLRCSPDGCFVSFIAKMGSAITYDCMRGTESGEERFDKFANNSGIVGGEHFRFNPFRQVIDCHEYIFVPSEVERPHGSSIPKRQRDFTNWMEF
ncbi:hypothetical protein Tco_0109785 [Tanacetum coccineum]